MAVKDIGREAVERALDEFLDTSRQDMLEKYGGGPSTKWYIEADGRYFDQKLIVRAAHMHQGLGQLGPRGSEWFNADQARSHLKELGYRVVTVPERGHPAPERGADFAT